MTTTTSDYSAELKAQGALEAARDPNSSVDADAAEKTVMNQAKAAGAPTFEFDPDASPEEKKAQMEAVRRIMKTLRASGANLIRSKQGRDIIGSIR